MNVREQDRVFGATILVKREAGDTPQIHEWEELTQCSFIISISSCRRRLAIWGMWSPTTLVYVSRRDRLSRQIKLLHTTGLLHHTDDTTLTEHVL